MSKICVDCASVPCRLPEQTARDVDALVKTLPSGLSFQTKAVGAEYQFEPGERSEVSILTAKTVDQSNEVVLPEGLDLESYRSSLIVLWNHNKDRPVATCQWIKIFKDQVRAKTVYPERPDDVDACWWTDEVWGMTKCNPPILRCKSIGFIPLLPKRDPTAQELELHPDWEGAGVWEKTLLLEYSCVYSGCNQEALVLAVNQKLLDPTKIKAMGLIVPEEQTPEPELTTEVNERPPAQVVHKDCCGKLTRYKSLPCVQAQLGKFKHLPEDQAIALAYANCVRGKAKRKPDMDTLIKRVAAQVDVEEIVDKAMKLYKNRGRA